MWSGNRDNTAVPDGVTGNRFNLLLNNEKIGPYRRNQGFRSWGVAFPWGRGIHNKLGVGVTVEGRGQAGAWSAVEFGLG